MPLYFAHGFRWPRDGFTGIRVHAIVHNLEPVSVEYIQNQHSRQALRSSLCSLYPEIIKRIEVSGQRVDFLEMYDPNDESPSAVTQPYAFVCDRIAMFAGGDRAEYHLNDLFQTQAAQAAKEARKQSQSSDSAVPSTSPERSKSPATVKKQRAKTQPMSIEKPFNSPPDIRALSVNPQDIISDNPISPDAWDALAELRDNLAKGEKIGWWVILNGDPERAFDPSDDEEDEEVDDEDEQRTEVGDSVSEGVKELRPKVSESGLDGQSRTLPLRGNRLSGLSAEEKEVLSGPIKQISTAGGFSATRPAVRSPTGGRIPPPVPPPAKSAARTTRHNHTISAFPKVPSPPENRDKELPPSPEEAHHQPQQHHQRGNSLVDEDPSKALAREKDGAKKESLRKKFFGKKMSGSG
jgi:hypothetical protein